MYFSYLREPPPTPVQASQACYTVPKAAHISEKYLGVYMGASHLAGKFPKVV